MNKQHIQISSTDREYLKASIRKGELKVKPYRHAISLLELNRGQTYTAASKTVKITIATLSTEADHYRENGLQALYDRPRFARPIQIDGEQRAKSLPRPVVRHPKDTPNGVCGFWQIKWSSLVLASKSRIPKCERFSHSSWRAVPEKNVLKPNIKQTWCDSNLDVEKLLQSRKEQILRIAQKNGAYDMHVFGSVAHDEACPDSDIDFLVKLEAGRSLLNLARLLRELQSLLGLPVDVVIEAGLPPRIRPTGFEGCADAIRS